jgi:hypothetical protein
VEKRVNLVDVQFVLRQDALGEHRPEGETQNGTRAQPVIGGRAFAFSTLRAFSICDGPRIMRGLFYFQD